MGSIERLEEGGGGRKNPFASAAIFVFGVACTFVLSGCGAKKAEVRTPRCENAGIEEFLPELSNLDVCRNGVDDNDSGFIDEGCAEGRSGRVEFYLAWPDRTLSLDLWVTGPDGGVAEIGRETPAGLVKLLDCPEESGCQGQNYEKVILEREREPSFGRYRIVVEAPSDLSTRSYPFTIGIVDRRVTRAFRGSIDSLSRRAELVVELFADGRAPALIVAPVKK